MKPRRWFRFSLRTSFVLVTLFSVWLGAQVKWMKNRWEARLWIRQHGVLFDDEGWTPKATPRLAPLSIGILGEAGASDIELDSEKIPNDEWKATALKMRSLFPEATVHVAYPGRTVIFDENSSLWHEQP